MSSPLAQLDILVPKVRYFSTWWGEVGGNRYSMTSPRSDLPAHTGAEQVERLCWRMLTYADVCCCTAAPLHREQLMSIQDDIERLRWRMLTYADVCCALRATDRDSGRRRAPRSCYYIACWHIYMLGTKTSSVGTKISQAAWETQRCMMASCLFSADTVCLIYHWCST